MHPYQLFWLWLTSPEYRLMRKAYQSIQKKQKDTKGEDLMACQVLCSDECLIGVQSKAC